MHSYKGSTLTMNYPIGHQVSHPTLKTGEDFDIHRCIEHKGFRNFKRPLYRAPYIDLRVSSQKGLVHSHTDLIFAEITPDISIAIPKSDASIHQVIQGLCCGIMYVVFYCRETNAGALFSPRIGDIQHHFFASRIHNGNMIFEDEESHSLWDGITGNCVYGALQGTSLSYYSSLRFLTYTQVKELSPHTFFIDCHMQSWKKKRALALYTLQNKSIAPLSRRFKKNIYSWDKRLSKYEMGMGVWLQGEERFYPYHIICKKHVIIDRYYRSLVVIWMEDFSKIPRIHIHEKDSSPPIIENDQGSFQPSREHYRFLKIMDSNVSSVHIIREGMFYFIRWYAFSTAFPNCEIYCE